MLMVQGKPTDKLKALRESRWNKLALSSVLALRDASALRRKTKAPLVGLWGGESPRSSQNTPVWPSKSIKRSPLKIIWGYSEPVWPGGSGGAKSCLCCPGTQRPVVLRPALARSSSRPRLRAPSAGIMKPGYKKESTEAAEKKDSAASVGGDVFRCPPL